VRDAGFDVEDLEAPRRNVLVFYGVGGIGKSTLSRGLLEHLAGGRESGEGGAGWAPLGSEAGRVVPVRVDLSRVAGNDFEALVLALRLAVAELGEPTVAFDLAFQRYWARNHPGESLDEHLRRRTWFNSFPGARSVPEQMQSALADIASVLALPGTAGALASQGMRVLVRALREHRQQVRALASCQRLADLLEAEPDLEALSYYPHLLAWDLSRIPEKKRATLVVLLDTFEDIGDRVHRDLERMVQRAAWLMPSALFVITGRNRVEWADPRLDGQLDWAGGEFWPLLDAGAVDEPRQHMVGYLSNRDRETYLAQRLTVEGRPLIDDETRSLIARNSHGLPLYLDLAVMRYLDLYTRNGRVPTGEEFDLDFPALAARTFRDLTPAVRQVLRAVSLLESFSVELAAATAGIEHDAPVLELVERPFIDEDPYAPWPYHLHDLIRAAVRDADSVSEDRWSPADWRRAAGRAFDALGREAAGGSRIRLVSALRQGLRLASDYNLPLGWLEDAAFGYVDDFVWEPLELPPAGRAGDRPAGEIQTPADALALAMTAIARRQRQHRSRSADDLRAVLASDLLPPSVRELPRYFLAECERDLGNFDASLTGMRAVVDGGGRLAPTAARGLVHLARRVGQFDQVLAAADTLGVEGRRDRVLGDLWWTQGHIVRACAAYAKARDDALGLGQPGEAALSQACLAFAAAFQDRSRAGEQIALADEMLAGVSLRFAEIHTRTAELLRDAGSADDLPARAEALAAVARGAGLTSSVAYISFALCLHATIRDSAALVAEARATLARSVRGREFAYLLELTYLAAGEQPPVDLPRAQWLDPVDRVADRWKTIVDDRRRETAPSTQE